MHDQFCFYVSTFKILFGILGFNSKKGSFVLCTQQTNYTDENNSQIYHNRGRLFPGNKNIVAGRVNIYTIFGGKRR